MKFRTDFVTNSSSSSFIVYFDKVPKTIEEMQKALFEDEGIFSHPYEDGVYYRAEEIARKVFEDMEKSGCATKKDILELLATECFWGVSRQIPYPRCPSFPYHKDSPEWKEFLKEEKKVVKLQQQECMRVAKEEFKKIFAGKSLDKIKLFSYSDNCGSLGCAMEHGDLFKRLLNVRISQH